MGMKQKFFFSKKKFKMADSKKALWLLSLQTLVQSDSVAQICKLSSLADREETFFQLSNKSVALLCFDVIFAEQLQKVVTQSKLSQRITNLITADQLWNFVKGRKTEVRRNEKYHKFSKCASKSGRISGIKLHEGKPKWYYVVHSLKFLLRV